MIISHIEVFKNVYRDIQIY